MISENVNPQSANFNRLGIYVLYYLLVLPKTSECVPVVNVLTYQRPWWQDGAEPVVGKVE
jgi:hypothetical protein